MKDLLTLWLDGLHAVGTPAITADPYPVSATNRTSSAPYSEF